jgi:hypothetical protein
MKVFSIVTAAKFKVAREVIICDIPFFFQYFKWSRGPINLLKDQIDSTYRLFLAQSNIPKLMDQRLVSS